MNGRKCKICIVDVHRAFYAIHLRSKKQLENEKQNELFLPEWFFKEPLDIKVKKFSNPTSLRQLARDNIEVDD